MSDDAYPIRIVIADAQSVVRSDLRRLLDSEPGLEVLGEASDTHDAVQLARQVKPDILLLDLALSREFKHQALNSSTGYLSLVRILVMVSSIQKVHVVEAFRLGAQGLVLKTSPPRVWFKSIRSVMAGRYWLESESVGILVEALRESLSQSNEAESPKDYGLTRRELEIISKVASGRSNKEVGEEFSISERTVKHHLTSIFGKVGVSSRLQLALFAVNHHLTRNQEPALALQSIQAEGHIN